MADVRDVPPAGGAARSFSRLRCSKSRERLRFGYNAAAVAERLRYRGPSSVGRAVRRIAEAPEGLRAIAAMLEGKLIWCLLTIQALTPIAPLGVVVIRPSEEFQGRDYRRHKEPEHGIHAPDVPELVRIGQVDTVPGAHRGQSLNSE